MLRVIISLVYCRKCPSHHFFQFLAVTVTGFETGLKTKKNKNKIGSITTTKITPQTTTTTTVTEQL